MAIESDSPTHRQHKRTKKTHHEIPPTRPEESSHLLPNLPPEIIFDILSRLPVKSLLQSRSVSKSWLSLISDPRFVKTHLSLASNSHDYTHHRLVLSSVRPHFDLKSYSLYSVLNELPDIGVELDYPMKDPYHSVWIVGSCNGLVCVAIEEDAVFLWNPSTRKSNRLPDLGVRMLCGCFVIYGFGYDVSNDDYKVVVMFCVLGNGGSYETEVKVYSLRANSWKGIGEFSYGIPVDDSGKYVNGFLHWTASGINGSSYSWDIVSLDLAKETYRKVVQPNYGDGSVDSTLGVLNGCLCVLRNFFGTRADVWVMQEYGKTESWSKLFSIPLPDLTFRWRYEYSSPLCISRNGEILLQFGPQLVLCNPKDGTFKNAAMPNLCPWLDADTYVESLVSPIAENVVLREHQ